MCEFDWTPTDLTELAPWCYQDRRMFSVQSNFWNRTIRTISTVLKFVSICEKGLVASIDMLTIYGMFNIFVSSPAKTIEVEEIGNLWVLHWRNTWYCHNISDWAGHANLPTINRLPYNYCFTPQNHRSPRTNLPLHTKSVLKLNT